jgi:hypothetical protein
MSKAQRKSQQAVQVGARFTELTDAQVGAVTGGSANIYYDASTGTYILRPAGQVYVGPGMLVGHT